MFGINILQAIHGVEMNHKRRFRMESKSMHRYDKEHCLPDGQPKQKPNRL